MAREMQEAIQDHIEAASREEENQRLRQEFAAQSCQHIPFRESQPLPCRPLFDFHTYTIYRQHKDKNPKNAVKDKIAQVNVIIQPRITYRVRINNDRLYKRQRLLLRSPLGAQGFLRGGRSC